MGSLNHLTLLACVATSACGSPTEETTPYRIRFSLGALTLQQLDSKELIVELVRPTDVIRVRDAMFSTSDASIATVSSGGVLTSIGPRGAVSVIASRNGLADTLPVTVVPVAGGISAGPQALRVRQDGILTVTATQVDLVGAPIAGVPVTLTVLDPWVINLSGTTVTVVGYGSEGHIQALASPIIDTLVIDVVEVAAYLQTSVRATAFREGQRGWVGVYLYDLFGGMVDTAPVIAVSSDPGVVTAQGNDLLGVGAGRAVVTFSRGPFSVPVPVTVSSASLDPSILFRVETPGPPTAIADGDYPGWVNPRQVFVPVPEDDVILQMEWGSWGFLDTLIVPGGPSVLAARDTGPLVAGLARDSALAKVDPVARMVTGRAALHGVPMGVELSPDGLRAFVLRDDGMVIAVSVADMRLTDSLLVPGAVHLRRDPSGERLLVAVPDSESVWVVPCDSLQVAARWPTNNRPRATAATTTRNELYVAGERGTLAILDLTSGQVLADVPVGDSLTGVTLLDSGSAVEILALAPSGVAYGISPVDRAVKCTAILGGAPTGAIGSVLADMALIGNAAGWVDFVICNW